MKFIVWLVLTGSLVLSCNSKDKRTPGTTASFRPSPPPDSTLVTGSSWGLINANATIDSIKTRYGAGNVKDERVCGAECVDSVDVTILYPETNRQFVIYWNDSAYHQKIAFVRASGDSSPYHTSNGIKIGTTLKRLVELNTKPIVFSGFGWDYGGGIINLNKGALDGSTIHFTLDLADGGGDNSLFGDTELNSDMPVVKKLQEKILVRELFLSFNN